MQEYVRKVKELGRAGVCEADQLEYYLPNLPTLRGSEPIFTIGHADAKMYIDADVEWFVKGLHLIEMEYKRSFNNSFGFGSPSPTAKVIDALQAIETDLATELRKWVKERGGNYYIEPPME